MKNHLYCLAFTLLLTQNANAQVSGEQLYMPYNNPPVVNAENRTLDFAWAGGANNPQLDMADLNKDGVKDLVIFDPNGGVSTFLNMSSISGSPKYEYHPEYERAFPPLMNGYMKFYDYNQDGIPDLVYKGFLGVTPLRGRYDEKNQLYFDHNTKFGGFYGLRYLTGGSGMVNVYVAPSDLPAIADVDGDGDMDILSYEINGITVYYYRNCQKEEGLPNDSIKICVKDACWGKTSQFYERQLHLGISCGTYGTTCKGCDAEGSGNKTTHAGNTLTLVDFDNDKDYDVFNANVSYSDIQYLRNGKKDYNHPIDTMVAEDTLWGANGKKVYMPQQPAAYWLDLDNDGDKDLAFCPFIANTENYKSIVYYKNTGTSTVANFNYQSDTLFMQDMIDVGTGSAPVFYDYNKDGKPDMFISGEGFYDAATGINKHSVIYYFENTSTPTAPSFQLKTRDFLNLSSSGIGSVVISMGDLDGDGKDDLVFGKPDGTIFYMRNNAASALIQPVWQNMLQLEDQNGKMDVGDYAAPFIYDINKDGSKDLVVGCREGRLFYYKNVGGAAPPNFNPNFNLITDTLGGIYLTEYGSNSTYLSPFIGKVDNSGKDFLMIGSKQGIIYRYDNFQSGNINAKYTRLDSAYSRINVRDHARLSVADIDGDGKYEMVIGSHVGGVRLLKQYLNVDVSDPIMANGGVNIYPNPASTMVNIGWLPSFASGNVHIMLVSVTGQKLYEADVNGSLTNAQIDVSAIPSGTYYCIVRSAENQASAPVSILR